MCIWIEFHYEIQCKNFILGYFILLANNSSFTKLKRERADDENCKNFTLGFMVFLTTRNDSCTESNCYSIIEFDIDYKSNLFTDFKLIIYWKTPID